MKAQRLRQPYQVEELSRVYEGPYDHSKWPEHQLRIRVTSALANHLIDLNRDRVGADLSCGDGALLRSLNLTERHFGDLRLPKDVAYREAPVTTGLSLLYNGFIENNLNKLPPVDVFVLTETIEHLSWPEDILFKVAEKTRRLILSTPIEAWEDRNPEHYWAWDQEWVEDMAREAGFNRVAFAALDCRSDGEGYLFGIWGFSK